MNSPLSGFECRSRRLRFSSAALTGLALTLAAEPTLAGLISWDSTRAVRSFASLTYSAGGLLCGLPFQPPCTTVTATDGPHEQDFSGGGPWNATVVAQVTGGSFLNPQSAVGAATQTSDVSVSGDHLSAYAEGSVARSTGGSTAASDFVLSFTNDTPYAFSLLYGGDASLWFSSPTDFVAWSSSNYGYEAAGTFAPGSHVLAFYPSAYYVSSWGQSYGLTIDLAPQAPLPAVPEPETAWMLAAALLGLASLRAVLGRSA